MDCLCRITVPLVNGMLVGYARCATQGQDLRAQRTALAHPGVAPDRVYTDSGFTGSNRGCLDCGGISPFF